MLTHRGGGAVLVYSVGGESFLHRPSLGLGGDGAEKLSRAHKCRDGKRKSVGGNVVDGRKATVVDLLLSAYRVELHGLDKQGVVEIRHGGIVKGDMTVFTDSKHHGVDGMGLKKLGISCTLCLRTRGG